ncbi:MAG: alpha-L-fucosidase [Balneolaceae bacterium]|nr:alpha-L-fucosidase [Balneolaceae bacterium]
MNPRILFHLLLAVGLALPLELIWAQESSYLHPRDPVHSTPQQVEYQRQEKIAFVHFGMNTYTNREWGTGTEDPSIFNPEKFDAEQWARVLSDNGFQTLVLTAKHHDGFALWPSQYTDHYAESSPWNNGKGDMEKEVAEACLKYGIKFGVYLSPWDMHEPSYGTPSHNTFYMNQLGELLDNYRPIAEIWFDGAKGEEAKDMEYQFEAWWSLVRERQPNAVMFSDEGPDVRWIGNEHGFAGETNWSKIDRDSVEIGKPGHGGYLNRGEPHGPNWVPGECNTSIRPGWFYHPEEGDEVKSVDQLMEVYYKSVGRNATMMLNIPPTPEGLFHEHDVERLYEFTNRIETIFDRNLAASTPVTADGSLTKKLTDDQWSTFWIAESSSNLSVLDLELSNNVTFDHIVLREFIPLGQRIAEFAILAGEGNRWQTVARGTTVGHKRILRTAPVTTGRIRIIISNSHGPAALSEIGLYHSG